MVCKLVPFFMPWKHGYGFLQATYRIDWSNEKLNSSSHLHTACQFVNLIENIPVWEYNKVGVLYLGDMNYGISNNK